MSAHSGRVHQMVAYLHRAAVGIDAAAIGFGGTGDIGSDRDDAPKGVGYWWFNMSSVIIGGDKVYYNVVDAHRRVVGTRVVEPTEDDVRGRIGDAVEPHGHVGTDTCDGDEVF